MATVPNNPITTVFNFMSRHPSGNVVQNPAPRPRIVPPLHSSVICGGMP
jgi:hypothetical protein